jgi:hypothetical protein
VFDASGTAPYTFAIVKRPNREWNVRVRQSLLTAGLVIPLVLAIATAPPFAAEPRAQAGSNMLGPAAPILAGEGIVPTRSGSTITIPSKWACGSTTTNVITLSNPDGSGRFRTASRMNGLRLQTMNITNVVGGAPQAFTLTETYEGTTLNSTTVSLIDQNSDGVLDGATIAGAVNATTSFVYLSNGDYVSIPWSQASALNINTTTTCAGFVPQVWIPLADTNGDGRGDSIVLDLDGNGVADADVYSGPAIVVPSVPIMGPIARTILILLMGLIGAWFLSRRRGDAAGIPA